MAVTTQYSTQYQAVHRDVPPSVRSADEYYGKLRAYAFNFTQSGAGDANSLAVLTKFHGRTRFISHLSKVYHSAFGTSRTLDLGWAAYNDPNGVAVAADEDGLDAAVNVAAAGSFTPDALTGNETKLFETKDGVDIQAKVEAGTIPDAATIDGLFVVMVE